MIREILKKCNAEDSKNYDAGVRSNLRKPRKRKLNQSDIDLAGKMLRSGSGSQFATIAVNNKIEQEGRGQKAKVSRRCLEKTFKKKYDAKVHRRQTKGTGSKDVNSTWAKSRAALVKQLLFQFTGKAEKENTTPVPESASTDKPASASTAEATAVPESASAPQPKPASAPQPKPASAPQHEPPSAPQPESTSTPAPESTTAPEEPTAAPVSMAVPTSGVNFASAVSALIVAHMATAPNSSTMQSIQFDEHLQENCSANYVDHYPDSPFKIDDRVESRYKGKGREQYSKEFYFGIISKIRREGPTRRPYWWFTVQFDDGCVQEVQYASRVGTYNVRASNEPFPPTPPPTPPPSPTSSPTPSPTHSPCTQSTPVPTEPSAAIASSQSDPDESAPAQPIVQNPVAGQHETWVPLRLEQILFLDEKHVRCKLGHVSGYEWLMVVDPTNPSRIMSLLDGGVREKPKPQTKPKFPKEARALFGVALGPDGKGRRMPMFNYTNKKVITFLIMFFVF